ncbi:MAG: hypothetical protein ACXWHC_13150 [Usitatibacter sp.]
MIARRTRGFFFAGFIAAIAACAAVLWRMPAWVAGAQVEPARWTAEALQLKARLARESDGGRVVLLSGSNALFGLSAERLERYHGVRAVNLATHAGLGRDYLLRYGLSFAKAGDVFVLPLEYELWQAQATSDTLAWQVLAHDPQYLQSLHWLERVRFLGGVRLTTWGRLLRAKRHPEPYWTLTETYRSESLNAWGDETVNTPSNASQVRHESIRRAPALRFELDPGAVENVAAFRTALAQRGARLVVAFPNVFVGHLDWERNGPAIEGLRRTLLLRGIALIGDPLSPAFEMGCAYDRIYHPTTPCQERNTDRLASDLRRAGMLPTAESQPRSPSRPRYQ